MVAFSKIVLAFGCLACTAAQQCQAYWKGTAPICRPDDSCNAGWEYKGVTDVRGDGARCFTGKKKLCQCIAPGGGPGCVPTLPPHEYHSKWVTLCDNGCNVYICGVWFFHFWKRDLVSVEQRGIRGVQRRRVPCEDAPEQPHCQGPDPVDPTTPSTISAKPLTHDDILKAYQGAEYGVLVEKLDSVGENTADKTQEELALAAFTQFEQEQVVLNIGQVDAKASFDGFGNGQGAWAYSDSVAT